MITDRFLRTVTEKINTDLKDTREMAVLKEMTEMTVPLKGRTLYISSLPPNLTDEEFKSAFEKFGEVISFNIVKDHATKQSREFGFVKYLSKDSIDVAVKEMNDTVLGGRAIRVEVSRRSEPRRQTPGRYMGSSRFRGDERDGRDNRNR